MKKKKVNNNIQVEKFMFFYIETFMSYKKIFIFLEILDQLNKNSRKYDKLEFMFIIKIK